MVCNTHTCHVDGRCVCVETVEMEAWIGILESVSEHWQLQYYGLSGGLGSDVGGAGECGESRGGEGGGWRMSVATTYLVASISWS